MRLRRSQLPSAAPRLPAPAAPPPRERLWRSLRRALLAYALVMLAAFLFSWWQVRAMVLSMFFFGGPSLHYFALALTIGILFGIYSSVFVAAAIAMWLGVKREDLVKQTKKEHDPNDPNAGATV